jgi:hypothetical protein
VTWLALASTATAQDVQIDFDTWPDAPCESPGVAECEYAWIEADPHDPSDMMVTACGAGRCLDVGWTADQSIRRIRTPWAPPMPVTTAYVEVRVRFGPSYRDEASSTGWANPHYQPLARLHGEDPTEFGVDLAIIHLSDRPPFVALLPAPDTAVSRGVRASDLDAGCTVELPDTNTFITIQAGINRAAAGYLCQLTIEGMASMGGPLVFGGGLEPDRQRFASASFLGRVSNDSGAGHCGGGWPPCGGDERRGLVVDDLCVSDRIEAASDGTCEPSGAVMPPDGDSGASSGVRFRGEGGCECHAARGLRATDLSLPLLLGLLSVSRRRRARRRT